IGRCVLPAGLPGKAGGMVNREKESPMNARFALMLVTLIFAMAVAAGCQKKSEVAPSAGLSSGPLDIRPITEPEPVSASAAAPLPSYTPASTPVVTPVVTQTPSDTYAHAAGAGESGTSASNGSTYVVKKGDTLFGIAQAHYGNGNQWRKIAAANNLTPDSLKAGQT